MTNSQESFEFLDLITVLSFIMQIQNQSKIFDLHDVQDDNARVAQEIHAHLKQQDKKIDKILEVLHEREN